MRKITIIIVFITTAQLFWGALLFAGEDHGKMPPSAFRSSDIVGKAVENHKQEKLGVVEDLVIGPDGRVNYVVISSDESSQKGAKLTPIPFSAIDKDAGGEGKIVINVGKKELENAPGFAGNQWPDFSKSHYGEKLHGYYEPVDGEKAEKKRGESQNLFRAPFSVPF